MVTLSDHYPKFLLRPIPSWFKELTYEPVSSTVDKPGTRKDAA
jgi:hypothetical protein